MKEKEGEVSIKVSVNLISDFKLVAMFSFCVFYPTLKEENSYCRLCNAT